MENDAVSDETLIDTEGDEISVVVTNESTTDISAKSSAIQIDDQNTADITDILKDDRSSENGQLVNGNTSNAESTMTAMSEIDLKDDLEDELIREVNNELSDNQASVYCSSENSSIASSPLDHRWSNTGSKHDGTGDLNQVVSAQQGEIVQLKKKYSEQNVMIERLQEQNRLLSNDHEQLEIYEVQLEALEKAITQLQREAQLCTDKLANQEEASNRTLSQLKSEMDTKLKNMSKQVELAEKNKENMVLKFASREKEVLDLKKVNQDMEKNLKSQLKEKDLMLNKIKVLTENKAKLSRTIDCQMSDFTNLQKETDRWKEETRLRDGKIGWLQEKVQVESEMHKETRNQLTSALHQLRGLQEEAEKVRLDCQEMVRTYQEQEDAASSNGSRAQTPTASPQRTRTKQGGEEQRALATDDSQNPVYQSIRQEMDNLKAKHKLSVNENITLSVKVEVLEKERLEAMHNINKLKETMNSQTQDLVDLTAKLSEMEHLRLQFEKEKESNAWQQSELSRLQQLSEDLESDMEECRRKENELLDFTQKLTDKNVFLQSEVTALESKRVLLSIENDRFTVELEDLQKAVAVMTQELNDEKTARTNENQILARKLAEKTKLVEGLNVRIDDEMNENKVLKRKNLTSNRELLREVQQLKRRLELYEKTSVDGVSLCSRTSSNTSLDKLAPPSGLTNGYAHQSHAISEGLGQFNSSRQQSNRTDINTNPGMSEDGVMGALPIEPDKQVLIEKIVRLQRMLARRNEKIDFLDEHVKQLVSELKKKTKLIQNYILREETGTLSTNRMDKNKSDVSRRGGVMASVYNSSQSDENLTLELSLEINRKLQQVLEDTILKNIMLKENINTLGEEVAKLSSCRTV